MKYTNKYGDSYNVTINELQYGNKRTALEFIDEEDSSPVLVATVNIPDEYLNPGEIIIKNWSENEGVLEYLQSKGIVSEVIRTVPTGFCHGDVVIYNGLKNVQ